MINGPVWSSQLNGYLEINKFPEIDDLNIHKIKEEMYISYKGVSLLIDGMYIPIYMDCKLTSLTGAWTGTGQANIGIEGEHSINGRSEPSSIRNLPVPGFPFFSCPGPVSITAGIIPLHGIFIQLVINQGCTALLIQDGICIALNFNVELKIPLYRPVQLSIKYSFFKGRS